MKTENKTWGDVWNEITSAGFWWFITLQFALVTGIAAVNKWVIHLPGCPRWTR